MQKIFRVISIMTAVLLVIAFFTPKPVKAADLCVNKYGINDCYASIQVAINHAVAGDIIHVEAGTYSETLTIGIPNLTLISDTGAATTVINSNGGSTAVTISTGASGFTLEGFSILGFTLAGIQVIDVNDLAITNTTITGIGSSSDGIVIQANTTDLSGFDISGNAISHVGAAISLIGNGSNPADEGSLANVNITGNSIGIASYGVLSKYLDVINVLTIQQNQFPDTVNTPIHILSADDEVQSDDEVTLLDIDFTRNWWGSVTGPIIDGPTPDIYLKGEDIGMDIYIPWCADALCTTDGYPPVYNQTLDSYYYTIQAAIDDENVAPDDIIRIAAGTFPENVVVNKSVALIGAGQGNTIVMPDVSDPNCGGMGGIALCPGASTVFLIEADDVTISNLTIEGNNPTISSSYTGDPADIDARNGIITDYLLDPFSGLEIFNVTVQNTYLRGISASDSGTFNIHHNTIRNVQGDASSAALRGEGGPGTFEGNTIQNTSEAIQVFDSKGITINNNIITNATKGIFTDHGGSVAESSADLIRLNNIDCQGTADSLGIYVLSAAIAPTIDRNEVSNCTIGLMAFGQDPSIIAPVNNQFTGNTVTGNGSLGSIGVLISTLRYGLDYSEVTATFTGNSISGFDSGIVLWSNELWGFEPWDEKPLHATFHGNWIDDNTTQVVKGGLADTMDFITNWWGSASGPDEATIATGIQYNPWYNTNDLTSKTYEVCSDQPFTKIQSTITGSSPGDTLRVCPATYNEHLTIDKSLVLQGIDRDKTIIDGETSPGIVITIQGTSNVVISGFTITGSGNTDPQNEAGLALINTANAEITNNHLNGNMNGIALLASSNNTISSNLVSNNTAWGIALADLDPYPQSTGNIISANSISGNGADGIYSGENNDNQFTNNTIFSNVSNGIYLHKNSSNTITGNNIYSNGQFGIELMGSTANTIQTNNIHENLDGIRVRVSADPEFPFGPVSIGANTYADNTRYDIAYEVPLASGTNLPLPATFQAMLNEAPDGAYILVPGSIGTYSKTGPFTIDRPGLHILLQDGVTIQNSSPCFRVNASGTYIESEHPLGAKCIPTNGSDGIEIAADVNDFILEKIEIDGSDQSANAGISFLGAITTVKIVDNYIHDLSASAVSFGGPVAEETIQGNLFQDTGDPVINNSSALEDYNAEYNSWGSYTTPGPIDFVDFTPWTHVNLYLHSSGIVDVDEKMTITVYGNFLNMMGADFILQYPEGFNLDESSLVDLSDLIPAGSEMFTVDEIARTIRYQGVVPLESPALSGEGLPLFQATLTKESTVSGFVDFLEDSDKFSMFPGYGPSTNIYASGLLDLEVYDSGFSMIGTIDMQGRINNGGIPVTLTGTGGYGPYLTESLDQPSNNLRVGDLPPGGYTFTTYQPRYLNIPSILAKTIQISEYTTFSHLELKGGNAVWSNGVSQYIIDLDDASVVGSMYGDTDGLTATGDHGDVNFDGIVDINDLTIVGGNFDLTSASAYSLWAP